MNMRFERRSLVEQAAQFLESQIRQGRWSRRLPSERELCQELNISRATLQGALGALRRQALISAEPRKGFLVASTARRPRRTARQIAFLAGESQEKQFSVTPQMFSRLIEHYLARDGYSLKIHTLSDSGGRGVIRRLADLTDHSQAACWILCSVSPAVQQWFQQHRHPAIVLGSCYPGVKLWYVDIDYHAVCRHAAQTLLRLGHRRIALVVPRKKYGGHLLSEAGFREASLSLPGQSFETTTLTHDGTPDGIHHLLARHMNRAPRPTAFVVLGPLYILAIAGSLAQLGFRIPRDISLICCTGWDYMNWYVPPIAHYLVDSQRLTRRCARLAIRLAAGETRGLRSGYLIPRLIKGGSLGPVPASG